MANGRVRCGACLTVFDCGDLVAASSPPPPEEEAATAQGASASAETMRISARPRTDSRSVQARESSPKLHPAAWVGGYALAACILAISVFGLQMPTWSQNPTLRAVYEVVCASAGCDVPARRSLADIKVSARAMNDRPGPPEALFIELELANAASFRQPFPVLAARLTTTGGREFEEHRFAPEDYLPRGHSRLMTRNQTVTVTLQLDDPGPAAATYILSVL